jgi:endonuclease-3 related protein
MHWWPAETPFEMMVGAILIQNTSWVNVEKAIQRLKDKKVLTANGIHGLSQPRLASLIRSSGYYRIKAARLKEFVSFLFKEYGGDLKRMKRKGLLELREELLGVNGIGLETADSILLYGFKKPIFVVDAYTRRILSRHGIGSEKASYETIQNLFMSHLHHDQRLFNEYHALIVHLGKSVCKKSPECDICPLKGIMGRGKGT